MSEHAAFEQAFAAALTGGNSTLPGGPDIARALTVHRNTSAKAAQDALAANYPVVAMLVGDEPFAASAAAFVAVRPPGEPRLCLYGADFPAFLGDYAPFASLDWLGDVAALERAVVEALFAADDQLFDGSALDLERPLTAHAAMRIVRMAGPGASIWLAHQPASDLGALDRIEWTAEIALVTRPGGAVMVTAIDAVAAQFCGDCNAELTLGETAAAAARSGADLATLFAALIGAGAFTTLHSGD